MNHSCAANVAQALGICGRVLAPSAACASGTLSMGLAYEAIAAGLQDVMFCGGADEHHAMAVVVFDVMNAASWHFNDRPQRTPRPFAVDRGWCECVPKAQECWCWKALENAQKREGRGFWGRSAVLPRSARRGILPIPTARRWWSVCKVPWHREPLISAEVDYVNAHATATLQGDIAEGQAIAQAVGAHTPVSSLKGHMGHTMAASGALELIASLRMMQEGVLIPTRNLDEVDPESGRLDFS